MEIKNAVDHMNAMLRLSALMDRACKDSGSDLSPAEEIELSALADAIAEYESKNHAF